MAITWDDEYSPISGGTDLPESDKVSTSKGLNVEAFCYDADFVKFSCWWTKRVIENVF